MKLNNVCGTRIRHVAFVRFHVETKDFTRVKNQKLHEIIFIIYVIRIIRRLRRRDFVTFINDMNHQQLEARL